MDLRAVKMIVGAMVVTLSLATATAASAATNKRMTGMGLRTFSLGVQDAAFASPADAPLAIARSLEIHARYARIVISWSAAAPGGKTRPAAFNARSPADPQYRWASFDAEIRRLTASGLTIYATLTHAPDWAQQGNPPPGSGAGAGAWRPNPLEFGDFAFAAATRYSGSYIDPLTGAPLPRISIWQAWNEPNLPLVLAPATTANYRPLLNALYGGVKSAQPRATVVAAGLAPVKSSKPATFPKQFARQLLCLKPRRGWYVRDRSCGPRARFDVFSVHPYSLTAKPAQRAAINGNMFVADVPDVAQMLRAAVQLRSIWPARGKPLWSTEFAWFTNPPNKSIGDRPKRAARRTLAALFSLWHSGVTQVTWFTSSDSTSALVEGGGFYDADGRAKPTRDALRFPFYAAQHGRRAYVWGVAPGRSRVTIQHRGGRGWARVTRTLVRRDGLFSMRLRMRSTAGGMFRARQGRTTSIAMPSSGYGVDPF